MREQAMWYSRFLICLLLTGGFAVGQRNMNLDLLKKDTGIFEGIVSGVLKQSFTHPYAMEGEPLAAYLQGYGIVVSFHLYINRATIRLPYGEIKAPGADGAERRSREEQIQTVQTTMIECLASYGAAIKQLSGNDHISITAHIEDRNEVDPELKRTVLVLTATKDDIDLVAMRRLSEDDFAKKLLVTRY